MKDAGSDSSPGDILQLEDHFFRWVRHDSDSRPVTHELASLTELRVDLDLFLTNLEPGEVLVYPNAVTLISKKGEVEVQATVQLFVAQPSNPWGEADGGPLGDWVGWIATTAKEQGWRERRVDKKPN